MTQAQLQGRRAIVTGGTSGIGAGVAEVFVERGCAVAVVGTSAEKGAAVVSRLNDKGGKAISLACDVADEAQVRATVDAAAQAFGGLDILVNNAGIGLYKSIVEATTAEWDHAFAVNIRGQMLSCKHVIPHMQAAGRGAIVNISSVHSTKSAPKDAPYAATKGAIDALTRSIAMDFGPVIRVNSIAPGWVVTPLTEGIFESLGDPDEVRRRIADAQIMKRLGEPRDIGYAAAFLASDDASFITGAQLAVDGGLTAFLERWE